MRPGGTAAPAPEPCAHDLRGPENCKPRGFTVPGVTVSGRNELLLDVDAASALLSRAPGSQRWRAGPADARGATAPPISFVMNRYFNGLEWKNKALEDKHLRKVTSR